MGKVNPFHETGMERNAPACGQVPPEAVPEGLVQLGDVGQGHLLHGQPGGKLYEPVNIPCQKPLLRLSEVVLPSHREDPFPFVNAMCSAPGMIPKANCRVNERNVLP